MQSVDNLFSHDMPANALAGDHVLDEENDSPPVGPFVGVAIERSIDRVLSYSVPQHLVGRVAVGQRVKVPLGRNDRPAYGYVVDITDQARFSRVKPVIEIADDRVLVRPPMMELSRWISRYYLSPLGMVLEAVIPSAVKKRIGLGYIQLVRPAVSPEVLHEHVQSTRSPKRRAVLSALLNLATDSSIELHQLAFEAGSTPQLVRKLVAAGLVLIRDEPDLGTLDPHRLAAELVPPVHEPNEDQCNVIQQIIGRLDGGFSENLLFGVTGSGKTEVYLRCIDAVVNAGRQALVLVPEIALTPQTVRRFVERFERIAVLHSALTATERHRSWQQISTGRAQVIVGVRSAIFAPTVNLGLIIVDEEHELSYKQQTIPRYNARDVAIKRARIEGIPVVLGTATPALETWYRVTNAIDSNAVLMPPGPASVGDSNPPAGPSALAVAVENDPLTAVEKLPTIQSKRFLLRMPNRVRGLALPQVELVDLKNANRMRRGIHLISPRLERLLTETRAAGEQAILLLNRRGYANCIYCSSCNDAVGCKYCDATMTYHRAAGLQPNNRSTEAGAAAGQMHCHYCLAVNVLPTSCPTCGKKLSLFGLGTQRVEEELSRKFPGIRSARVDSDTMHSRGDYEKLLGAFGRGEIQVMLGTQMIAKGLDYPNVTLVGVVSGDTALALPDFRAAERTFQLVTQVAGRAGRGDRPGRVVVQSFLGHDPALTRALAHDFEGFAADELTSRKVARLPPFTRMVRIVLRDQSLENLHIRGDKLTAELLAAIADKKLPVDLRGPMPCAIERIANHHRAQLVLTARTASQLQAVLANLRRDHGLISNDRVAIDVDPISML